MAFLIGVGKHDITGPCVGLGLMGMSRCEQTGNGIHMRQYCRAFVIEAVDHSAVVALVCADLGVCSMAVKNGVVARLAAAGPRDPQGKPVFSQENLLITANHTHSGPGGYSHYLMYNFSIGGFNRQNYEIIVAGIVAAVLDAYRHRVPGTIQISRGDLAGCGWIRSLPAYQMNPELSGVSCALERVEPLYNRMTLLRFVDQNHNLIGSINWFALHPTNMGERNRLISGDNKGYAEQLLEAQTKGIDAFANSCCGDISPNIGRGVPLGKHDIANMVEFAKLQADFACQLAQVPGEEIMGPLQYRHRFIEMSDYPFTDPSMKTWPAALGYGMLNGSQEDSTGMGKKMNIEGITRANFPPELEGTEKFIDLLKLPAEWLVNLKWPKKPDPCYEEGHGAKKIFLPVGKMSFRGNPVAPSILPIQLLRIGSFLLIAHPGELTTVAGLRMRAKIGGILSVAEGIRHVEVACYANGFASYTTTPEEYAAQHYEGASTLFGPHSLPAYIYAMSGLAEDMKASAWTPETVKPEKIDLRRILIKSTQVSAPDYDAPGYPLQTIMEPVKPMYRKSEQLVFSFLAGHPHRDLRNGFAATALPPPFHATFFVIQRKENGRWEDCLFDDHWSTRMTHRRFDRASQITVQWDIPAEQTAGRYRIVFCGPVKYPNKTKFDVIRVESNEFSIA